MSLAVLAAIHKDDASNAAWVAELDGSAMTWIPQHVIDGWTK